MSGRAPAAIALLAAAALAGCGAGAGTRARSSPSPGPLPADVRALAELAPSPAAAASPAAPPAAPAPPAAAADADGTLPATGEFVSPVRSELAARVVGRVARVMADEGARVRAGQPLLQLETEYFKLDVQRAEAELSRAQAALDEARRELDRKRELTGRGSVTAAVFDRAQAGFEQARAAHAAAAAALALARRRLADTVMVSPIDGVVMERRADVGEHLGEGSVAFVIVQTAPLKLRFRVPERYLGAVRRGQTVRASVEPYPGQSFTGAVTAFVQAVDPATRSFGVEAAFANRDGRLTPGLFARVSLELPRAAADGSGGGRAQAR